MGNLYSDVFDNSSLSFLTCTFRVFIMSGPEITHDNPSSHSLSVLIDRDTGHDVPSTIDFFALNSRYTHIFDSIKLSSAQEEMIVSLISNLSIGYNFGYMQNTIHKFVVCLPRIVTSYKRFTARPTNTVIYVSNVTMFTNPTYKNRKKRNHVLYYPCPKDSTMINNTITMVTSPEKREIVQHSGFGESPGVGDGWICRSTNRLRSAIRSAHRRSKLPGGR